MEERTEAHVSQPTGNSLEEERDIAASAVQLVISGARKGAVYLCANVAEILRENRRLQKTLEAQKAHIRFLMNMPPTSHSPRAHNSLYKSFEPSSPSLSASQEFAVCSSSSSGRGSFSPGGPSPCLPPIPASQDKLLSAHRTLAALQQTLCMQEYKQSAGVPHMSLPQLHSNVRKWETSQGGELDGSTQKQKHTPKKKGKSKRSTCQGDDEDDGGGVERRLADLDVSQRGPTPAPECRKKHQLKVNDHVVLDTKQKGKLRFIGPLRSMESREMFVGVELDSASGDNDGKLQGIRYFRCNANHGVFATISRVRKLSPPSGPCASQPASVSRTDSSTSEDERSATRRSLRRRLHRTRNHMNISAQVHWDGETRGKSAKDTGTS